MTNFEGVTDFNGKHAEVTYSSGWGDPGQWFLNLDGNKVIIEDAQGATQTGYIKPLILEAERGNVHAAKFIRDIFAQNWQNIGLPEDVIKLVLEHVKYSSSNKEADLVEIKRLENVISKSLDELTAYAHSGGFKANGFSNMVTIQAREYSKIEEVIRFLTTRIKAFDTLQAGELIGRSWTNATFYESAEGTDLIERVNKVLQEEES